MERTTEELTIATMNAAAEELDSAVKKMTHCLNQLTEEQVWWRPAPEMNSIANLMLHLCGNVRQWIISGVGGVTDTRDRPKEFSEQGPIEKTELLRKLETTIAEAKATLANASAEDLIDGHRIQSFEVTGIEAIFHSVAHFQGHVQEIVNLTRSQLGNSYQFEFVPATPEQGAP